MSAAPGLRVDFYRSADGSDFTLGGISSQYTSAIVNGIVTYVDLAAAQVFPVYPLPERYRIFTPSDHEPPVWLVIDTLHPLFLIPGKPDLDGPVDLRTLSFGGNFAHSTDSLFRQLTDLNAAIKVHDRREKYRA